MKEKTYNIQNKCKKCGKIFTKEMLRQGTLEQKRRRYCDGCKEK